MINVKKYCAVALLMSMILSCFALIPAFAEDVVTEAEIIEEQNNNVDGYGDILSFSCVYDAESKKVTVKGTMNHDVFASHKDASLLVFLIPPGMSEYDVANAENAEPLAQTNASVNFGFSFKTTAFADRYSKYAIFLRSPGGELILGTKAQFAEVSSSVESDSAKEHFKGVASSAVSVPSRVDAETVIIDVYPNQLITPKSNGYVYQNENTRLFFDKTYVDKLDAQIHSSAISGARVYLRFLFENGSYFGSFDGFEGQYIMPDLYNVDTLLLLHSVTEFIVERYNKQSDFGISGIVAGKAWDSWKTYHFYPSLDLSAYAERCAFYATALSNVARGIDPKIDIILPFSSENFNIGDGEAAEGCYKTEELIQLLLKYFDDDFVSGFECSFLLQSSSVPFNISNLNMEQTIDLAQATEWQNRRVAFNTFLDSMSSEYTSTPTTYTYLWTPPAALDGNALSLSYVYSYYVLLSDHKVSSFVPEFSKALGNEEKVFELTYLMRQIDTANSLSATKALLSYFGKESWTEVVGVSALPSTSKLLHTVSPEFSRPDGIKGSFLYFDFYDHLFTDGWYKGNGCSLIKIDYDDEEQKALRADMSFAEDRSGELIYAYEEYENMVYTPYLSFSFRIDSDNDNALYEVNILCENSQSRFESSCAVRGNELNQVVMDLSNIASFGKVENIRIRVRSLEAKGEKCVFWLYDVTGYSTEYNDEELQRIILNERDKIKNISNEEEITRSFENIVFALIIIAIAAALGVIMFVIVRRDSNNEDE